MELLRKHITFRGRIGRKSWFLSGFLPTVGFYLFADAFPKTTRSIKELDPSLFAPWTETHAASPIAISPGTVFSDPLIVNTSVL